MKITGTIVDKNMALIGIVLKGKPVEFGMMGKQNWTVNPFSLSDAKKLIKKNGCSDFELDSNGNIVGKNNKKLSDLPMYDKKGNTVDNKITIKSAIEDNGKLVGAVILFSNGIEKKLKLSDLTLVYTYCEPVNFILKNKNDSYFITGKGETKKEDIPVEEKVTTKSVAQKQVKMNNRLLLDFYPGGIEFRLIYDTLSESYIFVPFCEGIRTYIILNDIEAWKDRYKVFTTIYNPKFMSKYFKFVPAYRATELCEEKTKYSNDDILYMCDDDSDICKECFEENGCRYCSYKVCHASFSLLFVDNSEKAGIENFDLILKNFYSLSKDIDIDIEFNYRLTYILKAEEVSNILSLDKYSIRETEPYYDELSNTFFRFMFNHTCQIILNKAKKYGLRTKDIEVMNTVYKDENGVALLEYCKPTTDYPLGYFKPLVDINDI